MRKKSSRAADGLPDDLDVETRAVLEQARAAALDARPVEDIVAQRRIGREIFLSMEGDAKTGASIRNFGVPARGGPVPVRLYEPKQGYEAASPLVVFMHGGGWSVGDLDCYDGLCADICVQARVNILSVEYRLSPETPFPGGFEDCLDVIRWVFASAATLNADPDQIAVMGDSAGGNLAAVAAAALAQDNTPALVAQFLVYPMLDIGTPHAFYPSRIDFGGGEFLLSRQQIDDAINGYVTTGLDLSDPVLSPTNEPELKRLPPTYLLSARYDPLFDECLQYAGKLQAAGRLVHHRVYPSIHAFLSFGVLSIAQTARRELVSDIRMAFGMSPGSLAG